MYLYLYLLVRWDERTHAGFIPLLVLVGVESRGILRDPFPWKWNYTTYIVTSKYIVSVCYVCVFIA